VRIVHLTDLHYHHPPSPRRLLSKRVLGLTNLYLGRRAAAFGGASRDAVVGDALALAPDLVLVTGDVSTLATPAEFATAREALEPLLASAPTVVLAGNHDRYTRGSAREQRMESSFGAWMRGGRWDAGRGAWGGPAGHHAPYRYDVGPLTVLALDSARPHPMSRGKVDREQLRRLEDALVRCAEEDRPVLLALHYPLLTADGRPYRSPGHGLSGVTELLALLRRRPVAAVFHGHDHHHRVGRIAPDGGGEIAVVNGGSSGLAPGGDRDPGYYVVDWGAPGEAPGGPLRLRRRRFEGGGYRWDELGSITPSSAPASAP